MIEISTSQKSKKQIGIFNANRILRYTNEIISGQDNQSRQSGRVTFPNSAKSSANHSVLSGNYKIVVRPVYNFFLSFDLI